MEKKKKENIFRKLARWTVRGLLGLKYEEKWFGKKEHEEKEIKYKNGVPDDSELIVSPARQIFQRFMERKFAVFAVCVVLVMFIVVFIVPYFMPKYSDAYNETLQVDLPPTMSMMKVPKELQNNVKMIDGYGNFTVGLSNDGKVYVWGVTKIGASGIDVKNIPDEVKNTKIAWVAAGYDHIIAIGEDGKFYGWGQNRFGEYARSEEALSNDTIEPVPEIVANGELNPNDIKKIECGYQASAILMNDGTLYIWGNKKTYDNMQSFIAAETPYEDIAFELNYFVALDEHRNKIITRVKNYHTLFRRTVLSNTKAVKFTDYLNGRTIESITCTSKTVCMVLSDKSLAFAGDFPNDSVEAPKLPEGEYFVDIDGGAYHYVGLTNKGNVYSFGGDHYYQTKTPSNITGAAKVYAGPFQSYVLDSNGKVIAKWGLKGYPFGTDEAGANIIERVVAGGRITMSVGAIAVIIEIIIGVSIGLLSGYFGGWLDILLMRIAEVFSSIPLYPFMLILQSLLAQVSMTTNQRLYMIMVILGILGWPGFAYITRAQILVARESEYVTAAQAMGVKETRIAFKHILPNIISVILVQMTLSFAASMQTETSLSFLGFGVNYPQPSWGNMLARASNATAAINFWWQWLFTSAILVTTTVCINTIGDTLRDVMDPKSSNDK